jgi:hypothetical protein
VSSPSHSLYGCKSATELLTARFAFRVVLPHEILNEIDVSVAHNRHTEAKATAGSHPPKSWIATFAAGCLCLE